MAQSPEQQLAEFMAPLPQWLQKALWHDYPSMTPLESEHWLDSVSPFTVEQLEELKATAGWQTERYPYTAEELRPEFEKILQRCSPTMWNRYCDNARAGLKVHAQMPRRNRGRKPNDDLAGRIWALKAEGKKNLEIQKILNASGESLSLEAVESYLKKRRRARKP